MGTLRQTHTYVELEVSAETYAEIAAKLVEAGYNDVFELSGKGVEGRGAIDMHGLALVTKKDDVDQVALAVTNEVMKRLADCSHAPHAQIKANIQLLVAEALRKCQTN